MTTDRAAENGSVSGSYSASGASAPVVIDGPAGVTPPAVPHQLEPRIGGGNTIRSIGINPGPIPKEPIVEAKVTSPVANQSWSGIEPGATFTVEGTLTLAYVTAPQVNVTVDGHTYAATVTVDNVQTPTKGQFKANVRVFSQGTKKVAVSPKAHRDGGTYFVTGDEVDVDVNVSLTHTAPTFSITSPAAGAAVSLNENGADVTVTVTTADQSTYGARTVSATVDGTTVGLTSTSNTQFSGIVHLGPMPLGNRVISVACACADASTVSASQTVTVVGKDAASPHVAVTSPRPGNVVVDSQMKVALQGTMTDTQSGVVGGHSAVAVALSLNGTKIPVTPVRAGDYSQWNVNVSVPDLGAFTVYVWGTDAAGNTTSVPLQLAYNAISSYVPSTLDDRLSDLEYLVALMGFARDQVTAGSSGAVSSQQLATVLAQPIDRMSVPLTAAAAAAEVSVSDLRVPVEILREHIARMNPAPTAGRQGEATYLSTAYEALLSGAGTSYAELRLARGADDATRQALAKRLGIPLYGASPTQPRPDQLDQLTLDTNSLTEAALESLFGLPATTASLDPLRTISTPLLTQWRLASQRAQWQAEDAARAIKRAYVAIVDPDVISSADVIASSPLGAQVIALLQQRAQQLSGQENQIKGASGSTPALRFGAMLEIAALGVNLNTLATDDAQGIDISGALASAGLDRVGFDYLVQMQHLAGAGLVTETEWQDAVDVLVGAFRRRQYSAWAQAEQAITLSPDTFDAADAGPTVSAYRIDPQARADWLTVLEARTIQRQALLGSADAIVASAEELSLPVLRDALLADVAGTVRGDAGDAMTRLYQVDFKTNGSLRTTRLAQATASLQSLLTLIREGDNKTIDPVGTWHLTNGTDVFDAAWVWMGSYGAWTSATTTFLFPEAALDPTLLAQTGTPSDAFKALYTTLFAGAGDVEASTLDSAVKAYEATMTSWLSSRVPNPVALVYLSSRSQEHQAQLAAWSHALEAGNAEMAREIFWGVPMLIGARLQASGQYQQALDWYWIAYPYNDSAALSAYDVVNVEVAFAPSAPNLTFNSTWTSDLNPFDLINGRPAPYLRATLLATISCLLDFADAQFTLDTDESVAEARNLYLTATDLLAHQRFTPVTPSNPGEAALPIPQLATLQGRATAQLAKLRQGRNIAGLPRTQGATTGNAIKQPTPYHFKVLLSRAEQLAQQAAQVEGEYLAALEKYDNKNLQVLDAQNALGVATAQLAVQAAQVQSATDGVAAAQVQQQKAAAMISTYTNAIAAPPNSYEQAMLGEYGRMRDLQDVMAAADATIGIAQAASGGMNLLNEALSFGAAGVAAGAEIAGYAAKAAASMMLNNVQAQLQANQLKASIEDRRQEWQMQLASAQQDALVAAAQVKTATDQVAIATAEQQIAQLQNQQAAATLQLLTTQFTNADLYKWMSDTLGGVYRYFIQQATATARLAQAQLAFERAEPEKTFIRNDYWQTPGQLLSSAAPSDTRGLTGAEQLAQDLASLDGYAFSSDVRRLNISQTFSLAQLLPAEFLDFRNTGYLGFATPMSWFDADFPGHYQRLIRQVRLTFVALVPPSRGVRATLSTTGISQVVTPSDGTFASITLRRDPTSISVTSPLNATGVFEVDVQADMLLPFEGNGVATNWQLSLPPAANPFDFSTISDVLMSIDYTALSDADYERQVVATLNSNRSRSSDCVFSLRRDFPDQWYALNNPSTPGARSASLSLRDVDFPPNITNLVTAQFGVRLQSASALNPVLLTVSSSNGSVSATGSAQTDSTGTASTRRGAAGWTPLLGSSPVANWTISFDAAGGALFDSGAIDDVLVVVGWSGNAPAWR